MNREKISKTRIISCFIFEYLKVRDTTEDCLKELEKLMKYCQDNNIELDKRRITFIIKNSMIVQQLLKNIISNSKRELLTYGIQNISNNEVILLFIMIYCKINSIPCLNYYDIEPQTTNGKDFTKEEEKKYLSQIKEGNKEIKRFFILANVPLVKSIAIQFCKDNKFNLDELIQEGILGMITAINKFDLDKDIRFITYAKFWIEKYIINAINKERNIISLPDRIMSKKIRILSVIDGLNNKLKRMPTIDEVSHETGLSVDKINYILNITMPLVSLNIPINDDCSIELQDVLSSEELSLEDMVIRNIDNEKLKQVIHSSLSEKEINILYMRYGINGPIKTLQEIGNLYGITREGARLIISKAIKKLKQNWNECTVLAYEKNKLVKKGGNL